MNDANIVIYRTVDGETKIDVRLSEGSLWLNQMQMTELFQTTKQNISLHINNIFAEGEHDSMSTVKEYLTVQNEGVRDVTRNVKYYSLDVIISVGYRVKSKRGTQFRQWATKVLHEYLQKGFVLNDEKLKDFGGGDYWYELLERIRDIRSSEKAIYRQVLDLYATSIDYDPDQSETIEFFKIVQNKMHYTSSKHTAAELIFTRADSEKPFMGLKTFKGKTPTKSDIKSAKNYMNEDELFILNRIVSAFFDVAELKAKRQEHMRMKDWIEFVDKFTAEHGEGALFGAGEVSNAEALKKAEIEYEKYKHKLIEDLTPIEQEYLSFLKQTQKKIEKRKK